MELGASDCKQDREDHESNGMTARHQAPRSMRAISDSGYRR
jgi:hypothetical protein